MEKRMTNLEVRSMVTSIECHALADSRCIQNEISALSTSVGEIAQVVKTVGQEVIAMKLKSERTMKPMHFNFLTQKGVTRLRDMFNPEFRNFPKPITKVLGRTDVKPIKFMKIAECSSGGWERTLEERIQQQLADFDESLPFAFFPGRVVFLENHHAVVFGPMAQTNKESDFELSSSFDSLIGKDRSLLFDKEEGMFYGGRYKFVDVRGVHPSGFIFDGAETTGIPKLKQIVLASQVGGARLRSKDIPNLIWEGQIRFEFIGLQFISFDNNLYRRLTRNTSIKATDTASHTANGSIVSISVKTSATAQIAPELKRRRSKSVSQSSSSGDSSDSSEDEDGKRKAKRTRLDQH
ncbi:hypothetical protein E1B28_010730 [Marasmius oreades]|uniref:Uncharacterized protein n=1 Tax=Marasmius oreades TaxID=181124 RepID=A0A9P7RSM6_9AGAR|nr:uncharacterized protein E1B28_010730 [Marasmius oreades]KAG7089019.1 hypothetical protein E1B28_010730 [Marasmius oreades]